MAEVHLRGMLPLLLFSEEPMIMFPALRGTISWSRLPKLRNGLPVRRAVEESQEEKTESEQLNVSSKKGATGEQSDLGEEIRKVMMERKKAEGGGGGDLLSGVAGEIREIEWSSFGKVLGTTGVVQGIIAGSSVVLLTVNASLSKSPRSPIRCSPVEGFRSSSIKNEQNTNIILYFSFLTGVVGLIVLLYFSSA